MLLRSLVFQLGWVISTIFFGLTTLLTAPLSFEWRWHYVRLFALFNLWMLEHVCRLRFEVEGMERIPAGPAIIFSKHQSTWETLMLQRVFPPLVWVLKRELLWIPFFGWGLALMRPIAINRKAGRHAMHQVVQQGTARLRAGRWVVIFPEGTRVAPGTRGRYRAGGAMLAEQSGFPIVPVAHNAGEFWPKGGFLIRPGVIKVVIGPAIAASGRSHEELLAETRTWIESTMARISAVPYPQPDVD
ncbi:MAG: lysophospholipid acyltransferase family protein [Gammaproteobacteria bacterium]